MVVEQPSNSSRRHWPLLAILTFFYLLNQLTRFIVSTTSQEMARTLHFGEQSCFDNSSRSNSTLDCTTFSTSHECLDPSHQNYCEWVYDGSGMDYQVLAGPVFMVIFTVSGIPISAWGGGKHRLRAIAGMTLFWSAATCAMAASQAYWHLVLARIAQAIGQAGFKPVAAGVLAELFASKERGLALSIFNLGIYLGFSASFAYGNFLAPAIGWRYTLLAAGAPGIVSIGMLCVSDPRSNVEEPTEPAKVINTEMDSQPTPKLQAARTWQELLTKPSFILLCLAGGIRNSGGLVWATNTQLFFQNTRHESPEDIGSYMSWIPAVAGSLGAVLGGYLADKVVKRRGLNARLLVMVLSNLLAAPLAAGALWLSTPAAYLILLPANVVGEMWIGATLAVVTELAVPSLRTVAVAIFLFVIMNMGGNANLLMPLLRDTLDLSQQDALLILYPGLYALGSVIFAFTWIVLRQETKRRRAQERQPLLSD
eukprot:m.129685 g.129685  ORF g.129685 m.129685 type:complete len:481 (-) comp15856_c0_seq2:1092-2534(-)